MANFEWQSDAITRNTPNTATYRDTQNVRRYFRAECGDSFKFECPFMAWLIDSAPKTMGDAADEWLRCASA